MVRDEAIAHCIDCARLGQALGSRDLSLWFADGSNYPGTANIRARKRLFADGLAAVHASLSPAQRLLIEYKPFEPAFYHTDIADWGMALLLAREAGAQAKVLLFASSALSWRHEDMKRNGASFDHDEYQPHVTISYAANGPDLASVEPFRGPIELGPEIFEELRED